MNIVTGLDIFEHAVEHNDNLIGGWVNVQDIVRCSEDEAKAILAKWHRQGLVRVGRVGGAEQYRVHSDVIAILLEVDTWASKRLMKALNEVL